MQSIFFAVQDPMTGFISYLYPTDRIIVNELITISLPIVDTPILREGRHVFLSLLQNKHEIRIENITRVIRFVEYLRIKRDENRVKYVSLDVKLNELLSVMRQMLLYHDGGCLRWLN
jgi:hypothetical protein